MGNTDVTNTVDKNSVQTSDATNLTKGGVIPVQTVGKRPAPPLGTGPNGTKLID